MEYYNKIIDNRFMDNEINYNECDYNIIDNEVMDNEINYNECDYNIIDNRVLDERINYSEGDYNILYNGIIDDKTIDSECFENKAIEKEIKNSEVFNDIKHILTSELRTKLLISLFSSKKELKFIRNDLNKPSTAILHGIRQLKKRNLIKKEENIYVLSSKGMILAANVLKLIENTYSINNNRDFWKYHTIEDIPQKFLKKIHYIHNARHISSENGFCTENSNEFLDLISKSRKIKILTPIFFDIQLDMVINNLSINGSLELITTEEILDFMRVNGNGYKLIALKKNLDIKIWKFPSDFKLFLTSCDNFSSLGLFSNEHYDDSSMLLDESKRGIKWGSGLFEHYKENSDLIDIEKYFDIYEGHE